MNHTLKKVGWTSAALSLAAIAGLNDASAAQNIAPTPPSAVGEAALGEFAYAYEGLLGTSLDLLVRGTPAQAQLAHDSILDEIDRLCALLSTYDSTSEISRHMRGEPVHSDELAQLLDLYRAWHNRTGGALRVNMAGAKQLWKNAAAANTLPNRADLAAALDNPLALNVDALGKGYIIDRAVALARRVAPSGLLNIGGDLRAWGDHTFRIGVADPAHPADNAPLLATFDLRDAAVATSGGYMRYYTINGRSFSHLLDPRTGWSVNHVTGATVLATDCVTANALSTSAAVLGLEQGTALAQRYGAGHLILGAAGRSDNLPAQVNARPLAGAPAAQANWPDGYQVTININLVAPAGGPGGGPRRGGKGYKRPYVAVWVEDAKGAVVKTITVWGRERKYIPDLSEWFKAIKRDQQLASSVARGTRDAGQYSVTWDGKDERGNPVAKGDYVIKLEINREHGRHVGEVARLNCGDKKTTSTLRATAESAESLVEYAPKAK